MNFDPQAINWFTNFMICWMDTKTWDYVLMSVIVSFQLLELLKKWCGVLLMILFELLGCVCELWCDVWMWMLCEIMWSTYYCLIKTRWHVGLLSLSTFADVDVNLTGCCNCLVHRMINGKCYEFGWMHMLTYYVLMNCTHWRFIHEMYLT